MSTNEDLMREIVEVKITLQNHIIEEKPLLASARSLIETHGDNPIVTRARIQFVNEWMVAAQDRKRLRRAIIEKSLVMAIWACIVFIAVSIQHELLTIIKGWYK